MQGVLAQELRGSFDYFWKETNWEDGSPGYGMTRDSTDPEKSNFGSIAAVGFALCATVIGVEYGYISRAEGEQRAQKTLQTFATQVEHRHGFFHHFIELDTGLRFGGSEISIIDTALFLAGAGVAGRYYGGETARLFQQIYDRIDWSWFLNPATQLFYMGYFEEEGGFTKCQWDHYAEQFLMYAFAVGSDTHPLSPEIFYQFKRYPCKYGPYEYIRSGPNSLFVYQYSHAFLDFHQTVDREGVNWWNNSVSATLAHRQFCIDTKDRFQTFGENSWGLSACHYKHGYTGGFGADPCGDGVDLHNEINDGTVALYGPVGSLPFAPEECLAAIEHFYAMPELVGTYGLVDSYNLDETPPFFDTQFLGIDKGIGMVQIANYDKRLIWDLFLQIPQIQRALARMEIVPADQK